ncbi:MAG: hypothetical protein JW780_01100 [Clostridiales bacterium]|nr:hypothetical protein [Clostridiales bacterium]
MNKSLSLLAGCLGFVILFASCSQISNRKETTGKRTTESETAFAESSGSDPETIAESVPLREQNYSEAVFDDTVHEPFQPGTWGEAEYSTDETETVNSGSKAIFVRCGAWEAFEFVRRSAGWEEIYYMYPNRYLSFTFAFNPGESAEDDEGLSVSLDLAESIPIFDLIEGEISPNIWYEVTVPLSRLNPDKEPMSRLVFFNQSGNESTFFIDDVKMNCRDDYTPPVMSRIAVEVGTSGKFAVVRFSTNEAATAQLRYGVGELTESVFCPEYRVEHEIAISGLRAGEKYVYQLRVTDHPGEDSAIPNTTQEEGDFMAISNYPISIYVSFSIDTTKPNGEISPYIYGCNYFDEETFSASRYTIGRIGGNRWTAYNWENNASNAGSDWYFHNDAYLSGSEEPAAAVIDRVLNIFERGATALVTVPIQGYVAKDKDGTDVLETQDYLDERFLINRAFKDGALKLNPNQSDRYVFQDEFVYVVEKALSPESRGESEIFYCLDNEPALWASTHSPIQTEPITYKELADKNIEFARAIKSVAPQATVFGFVGYGYSAFVDLQGASDSDRYGEFVDYYLSRLSEAEKKYKDRLVDVLDIHWYPEAQDKDGHRITAESWEQGIAEARMQAPRSLWDPAYTENSWITRSIGRPIALIPWIRDKIDREYPGTKLAISEYYFGGSKHISGAIAQADFLGIVGREGVFEATLWPMSDMKDSYTAAAFDMYLDYDGRGAHFGDISVPATTSNIEETSVYAALDSSDPDRLVIMAINKTDGWTEALIDYKSEGEIYSFAETYVLSETFSFPEFMNSFEIEGEIFAVDLAPYSVTCIILTR